MGFQLSEMQKTQIEEWAQAYYDDLYRWAKYKTGNREMAEDLVQDTFMAAWRGYHNFKGASSPKSWLFQILHHKIADHFRKSYRSPVQLNINTVFDSYGNWETNGLESEWESPNLMDNEEFTEHLDSCISVLPEKWAKIIGDKFLHLKKTEIICKENQISTTNYWQIIHRAKLMLKRCMEKFFTQ